MRQVRRLAFPLERAFGAVALLLVLLLASGCAASASMSAEYPGAAAAPSPDASYDAAVTGAAMQEPMAEAAAASPASLAPTGGGGLGAGGPASSDGAPVAGAAELDPRAPIASGPGDKAGEPTGERGAKQADPAAPKPTQSAPSVAQMLIYTAELGLQVEQGAFSTTIDRVIDLAIGMGGYVASHDDATVQVRVPSLRFRDALAEIDKLGIVASRSVQAQDVSEEFHDLQIRLKSLKATRDRLEQFLSRAKDIQEVLSVERELSRVNGEIDRVEGRMRYLAARAAFSTITVRLQPKAATVVIDDPNRRPPPPPPARTIPLPVPWLPGVGLDRLLQLDG